MSNKKDYFKTILLEVQDHVAIITMNRPEKLNACSVEMFKEMDYVLSELEDDKNVGAVIITGAGDRAFSSGVDFNDLEFTDIGDSTEFIKYDARLFRHIENIPQPVITAVNGQAYGYGCKLAIVSDIAIASEKARFGLQGIKVGAVHMITLGRGRDILGRGRLGYMLLSGETIDAQQAERYGIVQKVVTHEYLLTEVKKLAQTISDYSPIAVRTIKKMLHRGSDDDYRLEDLLSPSLLITEDVKEGRKAFFEKRKPHFKGR